MNKTETLKQLRANFGTMNIEWCSEEENKMYSKRVKDNQNLPENIFMFDGEYGNKSFYNCLFYKVVDVGFSHEERMEYLKYKELEFLDMQTKRINGIWKISIFFLVITILSLIGSMIVLVGSL